MRPVHVVVPAGIDDPARPSGGNVYDRRVCNALVELGWDVNEHAVDGRWPCADPDALARLADALSTVPDDSVILVDGLIGSVSAAVLVPAARRLRLLALVHLPLAVPGEQLVLAAARAVVTTSTSARTQLLQTYQLDPAAVHVVEPGADRAPAASRGSGGENLLCVAAVSRHKGHDVLLSALAAVQDLPWQCRLVGSLEREPQFVEQLRRQAVGYGLADRLELCGTRTGRELAAAYAGSDLLVHASRGETYGMVVTEALARALPVVATDVGGVPEALGHTPAGRPGLLVGVDNPVELAAALRTWLSDDATRRRLRDAAAQRRQTLATWETAGQRMSQLLMAATR